MTWSPAPCNDRFDPVPGEKTMKAVVTAGNGGFEKLHCREVKRPGLEQVRCCSGFWLQG